MAAKRHKQDRSFSCLAVETVWRSITMAVSPSVVAVQTHTTRAHADKSQKMSASDAPLASRVKEGLLNAFRGSDLRLDGHFVRPVVRPLKHVRCRLRADKGRRTELSLRCAQH